MFAIELTIAKSLNKIDYLFVVYFAFVKKRF